MTKTGKLVTYFAIAIAALTASYAAFGASTHALILGEQQVQQLLRLMDTDRNGRVSKAEFMSFMSQEFETSTIAANSTPKSFHAAVCGSIRVGTNRSGAP
jgi:hypothetical protein